MNEVAIVAIRQNAGGGYDSIAVNQVGAGISDSKVTGTISREINSIHSMEFVIYPNHPAFDFLTSYKTRIIAGYDMDYGSGKMDDLVFFGRVLKITPSMESSGELRKNVVCENYMGFLCDSVTELKVYEGTPAQVLEDLFGCHNSQLKKDVFKLGKCAFISHVQLEGEGESIYDFLAGKFLQAVDGEFWLEDLSVREDGRAEITLALKKDEHRISNNRVKIGDNLISYSMDEDFSNVCTRVIPVGTKIYTDEDNLERVDIRSVNANGMPFLYVASDYGIIAKTVLFQDIEDPEELLKEGKKYLEENKSPTETYQMTAFDNHKLDPAIDRMEIGTWHYVDVPILGVENVLLRITKKTICIENPANDTFTVGMTKTASSAIGQAVTAADVAKVYDAMNISDTVNTHRINAVEGNIRKLYTEDLTAINADIQHLQAREAKISTVIFGTAQGEYISVDFSNAVVSQISDGVITNAMILSLSADKLTAGRISTNLVDIGSDDGMMTLKDETIQIYDGNHVRVQIGKDSRGDYNLALWDASGNILWDAAGIGEAGIRNELIVDRMVAEDAAINGKKVDLPSLIREINDGKEVIKSSHISYDPTGQTLDIAFNRVESQLLGDVGFNLYNDSKNMEDGWVYMGDWTWGGVEGSDGFRYGSSASYGYVDNIFPLAEGVSYTLSAWVKGDMLAYYPTVLEEGEWIGEYGDWTRVSYTFEYSASLGKPVFSSPRPYFIYGIKLEYGGNATAWCLTAEEQDRIAATQITALKVANGNIEFLLYKKEGVLERMATFEMTVERIGMSVQEIGDGYVKKAQLQIELEAITQTVQGVDGKYTELKQTVDSIDLTGLVKFSDLKMSGQTEINGANITTGTISAERIAGDVITSARMKANTLSFYCLESVNSGISIVGPSAIIYTGGLAARESVGAPNGYFDKIEPQTAGQTYVYINGTLQTVGHGIISEQAIVPYASGGAALGASFRYWSQLYAEKGVINVSDRRRKKDIEPIGEKYECLWHLLQPVSFMFQNGDRIHWGMISQDVEKAMEKLGLGASDVAMFCKDQRECLDEETGEMHKVYGEDGEPEYVYSLRYGELIALNTHMLQKAYAKIDAQEDRICKLEEAVEGLQRQLDKLGGGCA